MNCQFCQQKLNQGDHFINEDDNDKFCLQCQVEYLPSSIDREIQTRIFLLAGISQTLYAINYARPEEEIELWKFTLPAQDFFSSFPKLSCEDFKILQTYAFYWDVIDILPNSFLNNLSPQNIQQKLTTFLTFK